MLKAHSLTDEIVGTEEVVVPHLESEAGSHVDLRLGQTVKVLLLLDDYDLLRRQVFEGKHHPPVEVALSVHGPVVDVGLLCVVLATDPAEWR